MNDRLSPTGIDTEVLKVRPFPDCVIDVLIDQRIIRAAGGGQPADKGWLEHKGARAAIHTAFKRSGEIWLRCEAADFIAAGQGVRIYLDEKRRHRLSRAHTMTHVFMGCLKDCLAGFESRGAEIADDGLSTSLFFAADQCTSDQLATVTANVRNVIDQAICVEVTKAKSTEDAAARYPRFRVDGRLALSGRIRLIHIAGVDANPCSGTHVANTKELGEFALQSVEWRDGHWAIDLSLIEKEKNQVAMRDKIEWERITS